MHYGVSVSEGIDVFDHVEQSKGTKREVTDDIKVTDVVHTFVNRAITKMSAWVSLQTQAGAQAMDFLIEHSVDAITVAFMTVRFFFGDATDWFRKLWD